MDRRDFLKSLAALGIGALTANYSFAANIAPPALLPRRRYGDSGHELSIIGMGGIVVMNEEQKTANDLVAWAVDRGVNYFDVAPSYGDAQDRLGPALKPYRERAFLACKTGQRDAAGAQEELDNSLRMLQTDHFDLYQLHGLTNTKEVEQVFGPGGAMEVFVKARQEGKVRWLGFSAHDVASARLTMQHFKFDSVLFPCNAVCIENGNFGGQIVREAREAGLARLALKAIAWTPVKGNSERKYPKCWYQPQDDPEIADLLLRYTLSLPITAAVPPGDARLFRLCVELASRYEPLSPAERQELLTRIAGVEPIFKYTA